MPKSIPIPQIKLGKRKERSQMCVLLTDDGRWVEKEYPIFRSIEDTDAGMAWHISANNQYLADDGHWYQILTEQSQVPVCPRNDFIPKKDDQKDTQEGNLSTRGNNLFGTTFEDKKIEQFNKAIVNESWNKIMWIVSIVCGTMIIFAAIRWFGG